MQPSAFFIGDGHHREAVVAAVVSIIGPGAYVFGMWVEACLSEADNHVPSGDNVDLSGLVSPMSDVAGAFLVIAAV